MKIGVFTNCYKPIINGVVGVVDLLKHGYCQAGHEVSIFAPAFEDYQDREEAIYRYPSVHLTRKLKYPVAIPWSPQINKVVKQLDLDVIHCHHPFVLGPLAAKIARHKKIPLVYTFHTQYGQYYHYVPLPEKLVDYYTKRQIKGFCQGVTALTTPSDSARTVLHEYGVEREIEVIPNPINYNSFQNINGQGVRRKYGLNQERVLINIGRIAPEKNLELLLKAFRQLLTQSPAGIGELKLMIVGDGPALVGLKEMAVALGIADQVVFTGAVDSAAIPEHLAVADLFVMTSTSEVKPLAQLEALAAGVPIVAVTAAGANDTVVHGHNGLLVNADAGEFATAVGDLLAQPDRLAAFRQAARETAREYSHTKIAADYLQLFQKLLGKI